VFAFLRALLKLNLLFSLSLGALVAKSLLCKTNPIPPQLPMNITFYLTRRYDNFHLLGHRKNKPNSKPIKAEQSQFQTRCFSRLAPSGPRLLDCSFAAFSLSLDYRLSAGYHVIMRIPLTKYGWPQVAVYPAVVSGAMFACFLIRLPNWIFYTAEAVLLAVLIWMLSFFRDPRRVAPADKNLLLAPADGKITDIETIEENDFIGKTTMRIGIFLSILDAHINRSPCNVKVERITYKKGKYKNAMNPESGRVNEANNLFLTRTDSPEDKLIVRQISGAIARRIVCHAAQGQQLTGGEKFGMIKFGSRTELYVPSRDDVKCLVKTGDKVKAGITPLVRYEKCQH